MRSFEDKSQIRTSQQLEPILKFNRTKISTVKSTLNLGKVELLFESKKKKQKNKTKKKQKKNFFSFCFFANGVVF
jgi:hypothetical protein